jgi:hypothetical protein
VGNSLWLNWKFVLMRQVVLWQMIFKICVIYIPNVGRSSFWKSIQLLIYLPINVGRSSFWKSIQLLN